MRDIRQGNCPLCDHHEVVEGDPGEFTGDTNREVTAAFAYDARWVRSGRNPDHAYGVLKYYMWRQCGYLQWFVDNPQEVPLSDEHRPRLTKGVERKGPYR